MRRLLLPLASVLALVVAAPAASASENQQAAQHGETEYVVVYREGATDAARASIAATGGQIVKENAEVGVATVRSSDASFAANLSTRNGVEGVAENTIIGSVPAAGTRTPVDRDAVEKAGRDALTQNEANADTEQRRSHPGNGPKAEPLADLQWDMQQIHATPTARTASSAGASSVLVGIIDTGVDGTHPDIAPNFSNELSRNFTTDIPSMRTATRSTDRARSRRASTRRTSTTTDTARTSRRRSAAPINGLGIAGVAPKVTLVNLRAGQDSGYFFLQPTVDALTYAGDIGVDVVNMSYYVDPWLFNCTDNPADSAADQAEQRTIITAVQRALDYAHDKGVTLGRRGRQRATDYTKTDRRRAAVPTSPASRAKRRTTRDDPAVVHQHAVRGRPRHPGVGDRSSTRKSYYSDYGKGYVDVAAPGGDAYDTPDGSRDITGAVLAAYPYNVGVAVGDIDPDTGDPTNEFVVKDCEHGTCAYYQYLQGTSMASPHAVGVAALIVSHYGSHSGSGITLPPDITEFILRRTATPHDCPDPATITYTRQVPQPDGTIATVVSDPQTCESGAFSNGFYGSGIVDALAAVAHRH